MQRKEFLLTTLAASTFCYLGVWNLIYFSYHYIQRSRRQLIEKMSFENELKVQRLESERYTGIDKGAKGEEIMKIEEVSIGISFRSS